MQAEELLIQKRGDGNPVLVEVTVEIVWSRNFGPGDWVGAEIERGLKREVEVRGAPVNDQEFGIGIGPNEEAGLNAALVCRRGDNRADEIDRITRRGRQSHERIVRA